jgi:hypothetical protein
MNAIISEVLSLNGVLLVKLFGRQSENRSKYERTVDEVAQTTLKNNVVGVVFVTIIGIVSAGSQHLVFALALESWLTYLVCLKLERVLYIGLVAALFCLEALAWEL